MLYILHHPTNKSGFGHGLARKPRGSALRHAAGIAAIAVAFALAYRSYGLLRGRVAKLDNINPDGLE